MKYVINITHINSKNNAVTKRVSVNELNLTGCPGLDFAFPDTNVVMALLAMHLRCDWLREVNTRYVHLTVRLGRREGRRIKEYTKPTRTRAK